MKRTQRIMQAAGETVIPEAVVSPVRSIEASGDLFISKGNQHEGIAFGEIPEGSPGL